MGWAPAVATGCYDGAARLYLPSGKLACELTAGDGSAPITAVTLLPPEEGASGCVLVAGGHDGVVRSWSVSEKFKQTAAPRLFVGHAGAVSAVAAAPGGEFFASAGHDRTVRVWRREGGVEEPPTAGETLEKPSRSSSKRRKAADGAAARARGQTVVPRTSPRTHRSDDPARCRARVGGTRRRGDVRVVGIGDDGVDGRVRSRAQVLGRRRGKIGAIVRRARAVASVAARAGGGRVAWCGGGDRSVHAWDPRVGQTTGATTTWNSHTVSERRRRRFLFLFFFSSSSLGGFPRRFRRRGSARARSRSRSRSRGGRRR